ncbi:MAG: hypothetical protein OEZ01_08430, partial [Candidatus Heimdallarchaeota archaeon]|nr:hypothetical protein [Candidatus Heimdallarchaeota archaeon]
VVGNIIDFVVDKKFTLTKLILGGSFVEELLERIGIKTDDDPVVALDQTEFTFNEEKKLFSINLKGEDLPNKLQKDVISKDEYVFSKLRKKLVICSEGTPLGKVVDALIYKGRNIDLVLGDNPVVEFLENIGIIGDYDLLLQTESIVKIDSDVIKINKTKEDLTVLLKNQELEKIEIKNYTNVSKKNTNAEVVRYQFKDLGLK